MNLYQMPHQLTEKTIQKTLRLWKAGEIKIGSYEFDPALSATAETALLTNDISIFFDVFFQRAEILGIMPDGRLHCTGVPIMEPDPKYADTRRVFTFYFGIGPGVTFNYTDPKKNKISIRNLKVVQ